MGCAADLKVDGKVSLRSVIGEEEARLMREKHHELVEDWLDEASFADELSRLHEKYGIKTSDEGYATYRGYLRQKYYQNRRTVGPVVDPLEEGCECLFCQFHADKSPTNPDEVEAEAPRHEPQPAASPAVKTAPAVDRPRRKVRRPEPQPISQQEPARTLPISPPATDRYEQDFPPGYSPFSRHDPDETFDSDWVKPKKEFPPTIVRVYPPDIPHDRVSPPRREPTQKKSETVGATPQTNERSAAASGRRFQTAKVRGKKRDNASAAQRTLPDRGPPI